MAFFVRIYLLLRFIVVYYKQSPFLYAKVHKKVGVDTIPDPPVVIEDDVELSEKVQEDQVEWGWLQDDKDEDEDYSKNSNKFVLFSDPSASHIKFLPIFNSNEWNSLLRLYGSFFNFFFSFYLLLVIGGLIISDYIVYVSGKKRERSVEKEEEADNTAGNNDKKAKLEKEITDYAHDLRDIDKALHLDKKLPDSQKEFNAEARNLKKDYPTFFDEDSENTTKEGLEQLMEYLEGETGLAKKEYSELTTSPETKRFKQDSSEVVDDGSEPTSLSDLDGGE